MVGKLSFSVVVVVGVFFLLAILAAFAKARRAAGPWPFYGKRVLTDVEQVLYWRMVEALPDRVVLAQVQLSRFLGVKKGSGRLQWLNRINQKSADFVVCAKDFSVLAVVELDDSTHAQASRKKADEDKSKAISDAGLNLVRWHVKAMPSVADIAQAFEPVVSAPRVAVDDGGVGGEPPTLAAIRPARSGVRATRPG